MVWRKGEPGYRRVSWDEAGGRGRVPAVADVGVVAPALHPLAAWEPRRVLAVKGVFEQVPAAAHLGAHRIEVEELRGVDHELGRAPLGLPLVNEEAALRVPGQCAVHAELLEV